MLQENSRRLPYLLVLLVLILSVVAAAGCNAVTGGDDPKPQGASDDWQLSGQLTQSPTTYAATATVPRPTSPSGPKAWSTQAPLVTPTLTVLTPGQANSSSGGNENLGFSVGGAKDIQNFRENIRNNYLPLPTDVTYEGLFYDYYFDTGTLETTDKLFAPSYSAAVSRDPISGETEYYLAVGLNSGIKESDFARKKLNLVVVLDISGSMGEVFNSYYYDGGQGTEPAEERGKTKIAVARESVIALLDQLGDGDSFGLVLFNQDAYIAKPLNLIATTDIEAIKDHIRDIEADGSTNLDAGMEAGTRLFRNLEDYDAAEYENRIIFITDAEPNTGDTSRYGLMDTVEDDAANRIYSTFIGVGVDFNSDLVYSITKVRGANYYTVHSSYEFKKRMNEEFDYMVTPLVFDLKLKLQSEGWEIEEVYGSPDADKATGELLKVNTLFPSKTEGGETRGGLVLLKMRRTGDENRIILRSSYEDRNGRYDSSEVAVNLTERDPEYFGNSGIRKGILLSRYAELLKTWLMDERDHYHYSYEWQPCIDDHTGIYCPPRVFTSQWERTSLPLTVSPPYIQIFRDFLDYFKGEARAIGDADLDQEIDILETLVY